MQADDQSGAAVSAPVARVEITVMPDGSFRVSGYIGAANDSGGYFDRVTVMPYTLKALREVCAAVLSPEAAP